jgi:arylsulfatase A-like enzyme
LTKSGKPNILVLWGDDIGWWNITYYSRGQMGYRTPNIDRIGNEGAPFTDQTGHSMSDGWDWPMALNESDTGIDVRATP